MKRKAIVFLIGVVVALAALEGGLRGLGVVYHALMRSSRTPVSAAGKDPFVILCLGNSYTKGIGATVGMSYPEQLQCLLRIRRPEKQAVVVNLGRSVQNTAELLKELDANLERFKPDLVLLQTGQANHWNRLGYTDYLQRNGRATRWAERLRYSASEVLYSSRIYRLFLLWRDRVHGPKDFSSEPRPSVDISYRGSPEYRQAAKFIRNSTASRRNKDFVFDAAQGREAMKVFLDAIKKDPAHPANYVFVGYLYRFLKGYDEALRWYIRGIRADAGYRSVDDINEGYKEIREMRLEDKGPDNEAINRQIDAFIEEFNRKNPALAENLVLLTPLQLEQWVASDLREILRKIRASGAGVIVQNYPVGIPENELIKKIAESEGVLFVDQYASFEAKLRAGVPREALFIPDSHCNDAGYGLMAENIYQKIVEAGF